MSASVAFYTFLLCFSFACRRGLSSIYKILFVTYKISGWSAVLPATICRCQFVSLLAVAAADHPFIMIHVLLFCCLLLLYPYLVTWCGHRLRGRQGRKRPAVQPLQKN